MKALCDRLDWIQLYINGTLGNRDDPKNIRLAQDEMIACMAIADLLPEPQLIINPNLVSR